MCSKTAFFRFFVVAIVTHIAGQILACSQRIEPMFLLRLLPRLYLPATLNQLIFMDLFVFVRKTADFWKILI